MFKVGDKVVYISTTTYRFTKNKIYTIESVYQPYPNIYTYSINGLDTHINNFVSVKEYRKRKLKEICLK